MILSSSFEVYQFGTAISCATHDEGVRSPGALFENIFVLYCNYNLELKLVILSYLISPISKQRHRLYIIVEHNVLFYDSMACVLTLFETESLDSKSHMLITSLW